MIVFAFSFYLYFLSLSLSLSLSLLSLFLCSFLSYLKGIHMSLTTATLNFITLFN